MEDKEIKLLKEQLAQFNDPKVDFEGWKESGELVILKKMPEDKFTGKQIREIEEILHSDSAEKESKIKDIFEKIGQQSLSAINARLSLA